jgi:hypothetical protein
MLQHVIAAVALMLSLESCGTAAKSDAGPDAGPIASPQCPNCETGCCEPDGGCLSGTSMLACGAQGAWCQSCPQNTECTFGLCLSTEGRDGGSSTDPLRCLGEELPTSAPPTVRLSGTVTHSTATNSVPVPNATVSVERAGVPLASASTPTSGQYSFLLATNGNPLDAVVHASAGGYVDTWAQGPRSYVQDTGNIDLEMFDSSTLRLLGLIASVNINDAKAILIVHLDDCNGRSIAGAVVKSSLGGTVRYVSNGVPSPQATATDSSGSAFIFNVPEGTVTLTASVGNVTLRPRVVEAHAGNINQADMRP